LVARGKLLLDAGQLLLLVVHGAPPTHTLTPLAPERNLRTSLAPGQARTWPGQGVSGASPREDTRAALARNWLVRRHASRTQHRRGAAGAGTAAGADAALSRAAGHAHQARP